MIDLERALFDAIGAVGMVVDRQGNIQRLNIAAQTFMGYSEEEVKNHPYFWERFIPQDERPTVHNLFEAMKDHTIAPIYENHWISKQGEKRLFRWINKILNGEDGQPLYLITVGVDITEEKRMAETLRTESQWRQALLQNASDGIHITDNRGNLLIASEHFWQMLGYASFEEMDGMNVTQWEAAHTPDEIETRIQELFSLKKPMTVDTRHRRKDGSVLDVEVTVRAITIQGQPLLFGSSRDIHTRKTLENDLKSHAIRLERLVAFNGLLSEVNEAIARATDETLFLKRLCTLTVNRTGAKLASLSRPDENGWFQILAATGATDYLENIRISNRADLPEGQGLFGQAWRNGCAFDVPSIARSPALTPWKAQAIHFDLAATASMPIFRDNKIWAIFTVFYAEEDIFDTELRNILQELARDIGFGLDHLDTVKAQREADNFNVALLQNLTVGLNVIRYPERVIERINPRMLEIYAAETMEEFMSHPVRDFYPDEDTYQRIDHFSQEIGRSGKGFMSNVPYRRLDGRLVYIDLSGQRLSRSDSGTFRIIWSHIDVTERHLQEQAIADLNAERQKLLANTSSGIAMVRYPEHLITETNQAFVDIMGYTSPKDILNQPITKFFANQAEEQRMALLAQHILDEGQGSLRDLAIRRRDGTTLYIDVSGQKLDDTRTNHSVIIWTSVDVTERYQLAEHLLQQAFTDPLTRLPNRRALDTEIEKAMARVQRHDRLLAVVMIDLDGFKPVNDQLGHAAGDHLLRAFAERLQSVLRRTDYVARLGGDEFVVLLEDCASMPEITAALDKIGSVVETPIPLTEHASISGIRIGLSAGVCLYPLLDTGNPEALLRYADQALYESKLHKQNRLRFWTLYGESATNSLNPYQQLLHEAGVRIWYQPILDNTTRQIVGIEALARLENESGSILTPDQFLPHFNDRDLFELTRQVLDRSLRDLALIHRYFPTSHLWLSVNVDPVSISETFISYLAGCLKSTAIPPDHLVLEILEGSNFSHQQRSIEHLHSLKSLGIRLALDDIGSAYSSLLRLKELPIDEIKLDQGFIRRLRQDPSGILFAETVYDLARDLNVSMIVEGVENDAILDAMSVLDIPLLQGYAIARPMPLEALKDFLSHFPENTALLSHPHPQHRQQPLSWLGIYAKHVAYDRIMRKTIKHDPTMVSSEKLANAGNCPFDQDLQRLGLDHSHPIVHLHQRYHQALSATHRAFFLTSSTPNWTEVEKAHEQLLNGIQREFGFE